jgi:hypothetical protein
LCAGWRVGFNTKAGGTKGRRDGGRRDGGRRKEGRRKEEGGKEEDGRWKMEGPGGIGMQEIKGPMVKDKTAI